MAINREDQDWESFDALPVEQQKGFIMGIQAATVTCRIIGALAELADSKRDVAEGIETTLREALTVAKRRAKQ